MTQEAEKIQGAACDYVRNDYVGCPYCGEEIEEKAFDDNEPADAAEEFLHYTCSDCGRYWTEVFRRSGVILDDGEYCNE